MFNFQDILELFINLANSLQIGAVKSDEPLEKLILAVFSKNVVYLDNRKEAKEKYGFDFWKDFFGKKTANFLSNLLPL